MRASPVIVGEVAGQNAPQVALAENQNVIQTLAPDRADEPLREGILPRAVRRREDFLDPHALHSVAKLLAVDLVTVAQEIGGRGVVREGVHDLLGGPAGGGVLGHVEGDDATAGVGGPRWAGRRAWASARRSGAAATAGRCWATR